MYCHHCGNKLIEGSKFCNSCGKEIAESSRINTDEALHFGKGKSPKYRKDYSVAAVVITVLIIGGVLFWIMSSISSSIPQNSQTPGATIKIILTIIDNMAVCDNGWHRI